MNSNFINSNSFTTIDFETAQRFRWSICQVGLVRIVNGTIVAKLEILIQPPDNFYWNNFTEIHGIAASNTKHAPCFDSVWPLIEPFIKNQNVVAHNSAFDFDCLQKTLERYGIQMPNFNPYCTYKIYGRSLSKLCDQFNIELNHHNALSDALACSTLFQKHLEDQKDAC